MLTRHTYLRPLAALAIMALGLVTLEAQGERRVPMGDWPALRGPERNGISREVGLPDKLDLQGNLLWRAPFGGRSTPIIVGNRVCSQNAAGHGVELQERVMCLDANSGKVLWEYRFTNFQSDVPPHRLAWASPAADPATGNIYALGSGAMVVALSKDGKHLWHRSIGEEFAAFTTHGGRTMSPLIDGDLVIVSAAVSNWGEHGNRRIRYLALNKTTGEMVYIAHPGGRPYDTSYAPPIITSIGGQRLLINGLGDGGVHAFKPQTGEKVWSLPIAKRGVNTGVLVQGDTVFVSHGDENRDSPALGMLGAIDGTQTGEIKTTKWKNTGVQFGFSSPVLDGNRLYILDGSATLHAYDTATGDALWEQRFGTTGQQAPLAMGDGKLYFGTASGKVYVLRPKADGVDVLSEFTLPVSTNSCCSSEGVPEQVIAGVALARGRVFVQTADALYAFGPKQPTVQTGFAVDESAVTGEGNATWLQVAPTELTLRPGQAVQLKARLFDAKGRFLREEPTATWSLDGLNGTLRNGLFTVASDQIDQAGTIKATVGSLTGSARAKVARSLPWMETFEGFSENTVPPGWVSMASGQFAVTAIDGTKALQKKPVGSLFKRVRAFFGPTTLSDYTVEADVRAPTRRRQQADVGVTAQTYSLILYGTQQKLKLESWEPEIERRVERPFAWAPDTWQSLKLRVENLPSGDVKVLGKAWAKGTPEPAGWQIEKIDTIGNREGAPGLFLDAEFGAFIDNIKVTPNGASTASGK
jgi:outer membrane protein assembly factor BamB